MCTSPAQSCESHKIGQDQTARKAGAWEWLAQQGSVADVTTERERWSRYNIDPILAAEWAHLTWDPEDAMPWHRKGFTPEQAEYVDGTAFRNSFRRDPSNPGVRASTAEEWRDCELAPDWICECLTNDVWSVERARILNARQHTP